MKLNKNIIQVYLKKYNKKEKNKIIKRNKYNKLRIKNYRKVEW